MRLRLTLATLLLGVAHVWGGGQARAQGTLGTELARRLEQGGPQEPVAVYAVMRTQAALQPELSARDGAAASTTLRLARQRARSAAVVRTLQQVNGQGQAALLDFLADAPDVRDVRPLWVVGVVGFAAPPAVIRAVAARADVLAVRYDGAWAVESVAAVGETRQDGLPDHSEPGLQAINAPGMWARGYTGYGTVAFIADTGVDPYHPALGGKYAGHDGRAGAWYAYERAREHPGDCDGHGTHVAGTVLGLDPTTRDTIGVAPGAHWLGGSILCGLGTVDNLAALQWAMDPDGDSATNDDRPDVINNSWYDPSVAHDQCAPGNPYPVLLDNLEAAGIAVVFSAGNLGPAPGSITPPHSYNAGLVNSFTVGAVDASVPPTLAAGRRFAIAAFSSRGPATCAADSLPLDIKPEVTAPGVAIRSAMPDGGYAEVSGTSSAAPHVAGALLLLKEAFPYLTGRALKLALYRSAHDLGEPGEDNAYGTGLIDVVAAYDLLVTQGNAPVPPRRPDLAVVATGLRGDSVQCGGPLTVEASLRNVGRDTVRTLTLELLVDGVPALTRRPRLTLAPGHDTTLTLRLPSGPAGYAHVDARLLRANGEALDRALDLGASLRVRRSLQPPPVIVADAGPDATLCLGSPLVLDLRVPGDNAIVPYFASAPPTEAGSPAAGRPFVVNDLRAPTRLYGVAEHLLAGGARLLPETTLAFGDAEQSTLRLRALRQVRLRSVRVVAGGAGRATVTLYERRAGRRAQMYRLGVDLVEGPQRLPLGFELRPGRTSYLLIEGDVALGYDPTADVTDAAPADYLAVEGPGEGEAEGAAAGSSVYFDWEFGALDGCPAVVVDVALDSTRTAAVLSPTLAEGAAVVDQPFTLLETAPAARDYGWLLADTSVRTATGLLEYTPLRVGALPVTVFATDAAGCRAAGSLEVDVEAGSSSVGGVGPEEGVRLSPNPARGQFTLAGLASERVGVSLYDLAGRLLRTYRTPGEGVPREREPFSLDGIAAGTYTVRVASDAANAAYPLVVR